MVVRTRIYSIEIWLPEVIENVSEEYSELLEEVTRPGEDLPIGIELIRPWRHIVPCPICYTKNMRITAIAIVTDSACVLTTEKGTKIIRAENLRKDFSGARLVIFVKCDFGHMMKFIYQNEDNKIVQRRDKITSEKVRKLVDGFLTFDEIWW